jgi:hypothetical protein
MKTYWETPTSNLFDTANWSGGSTPGANDIIALTVAGSTYTVTSNTNHTVLGVTTGANATLSIGHNSAFSATEGTATGTNAGAITILDGSNLEMGGVVDNTGFINLDATGTITRLLAISNTTFEGGGRIDMTDNVHNLFLALPSTNIITNVNNNISGAGTITAAIFNNDKLGVIDATGTNNRLVISDTDVTNAGLIEATGAAGLQFSGFGTVANKGAMIEAAIGSTIFLDGDNEIQGGTLKGNIDVVGNNGALLDGSSDGTLSNEGTVVIENGASLSLKGVINNAGSINLDGGATATSIIPIDTGTSAATVTLEGGGQLNLSDSSLNSLDLEGLTPPKITLNNVHNTISGAGTIGASGALTLNNEALGIINATGVTSPLILEGPVKNAGLMEATGAAGLTINAENGGNPEAITNTASGVIEANTGSVVKLEGGIITGGTVKTIGTGVIQVTTSGSDFLVLDGSNAIVHTNTMINLEGSVELFSGSALGLAGTIRNTGDILDSSGSIIDLFPGGTAKSTTLEGAGTITLSSGSIIIGEGLNNVNDTISGSGIIENAALNNETNGVVVATGGGQLVINTGLLTGPTIGPTVVTNAGFLQALSASELFVANGVANSGTLAADSGTIVVAGAVTGTGSAQIRGPGEIEFGAASTNNVKFETGSTGELVLDESVKYSGTIVGFGLTQSIDLADINVATATLSYAPNSPNTSGVLTVNDHDGHVAHIKFDGTFVVGDFHLANDGGGGTLLTDPPVDTAAHTIAEGATLEIANGASGKITFAGAAGTLQLDSPWAFSGKVAGFGGQDQIDLADVSFGAQTTLGYARDGSTGGELKVGDGIHTAHIALLGNYMASSFITASDGHGGTLITAAPVAQQPLLATPHA